MKFKEYFISDITYGMLVVGASMEDTFDHIFFGGDWELSVVTARKDEIAQEYTVLFCDDDEHLTITACWVNECWSIVFNRCQDDAERLDDYDALANSLGEYIKQIAIEYITK